ncbi:hypothetical protein [Anaeromicropila herbilytica]|uniref:Uncharacterized protein n=1 Tax=Anaeromicropila herbilytica TaxID=2785025 RepID=A0A7R7EIN1_9FIRM|nr:hypothetical protein [Anaeromicropila herbilytica]BCN29445.1 hypothetical protein bsdtb5_07400 [Anaeromicropila herbilytica]
MAIKIYTEQVKIHETPLEKIFFDGTQITIEFDDEDEKRWCVMFSQIQEFKITTIDCFDVSKLLMDGMKSSYILFEDNSKWINNLNITLNKTDYHASFFDKSKHYIFPFQDNIVEVVSLNISIEKLK